VFSVTYVSSWACTRPQDQMWHEVELKGQAGPHGISTPGRSHVKSDMIHGNLSASTIC
jgi:hypothetical protein